ncbi:serine hydrolase domain-containing protein [Asticcacaulis sp.]|uniref:serine hydrolase domain-containing protein n=1 Tax=Asticcacaulis sp. TaxID=1872648 RepID=UPI002B88EFF7|nr:serine hydrolase domain-containing protein [Asticcacaulis sp.]HTM80545.1 serine hydrolase domain-containing protein [Asticcacaulis sp.]
MTDPKPRALLMRRDVLTGIGAGLTGGAVTLWAGATFLPKAAVHAPDLSAATEPVAPSPPPPLRNWPSLDDLANRMIERQITPGLSLSVMKGGIMLYSAGFGNARLLPKHPVDAHTGFRIASISKQFTAAAILLLAEEGKLSLGDPLARFLPDFPRADAMTLRELLSHTSGLDDYLSGRHADMLMTAQSHDYTQQGLLEAIKTAAPLFRCPPGMKWVYSNTGFALLGIIVERLSGLPLAAFCQRRLFAGAGMSRTAIDPLNLGDPDICQGHRATRSLRDGFGQVWPVSPSFTGGSGGLRSTSADLCRWHSALMSGKILKPESLAAMLTPVRLKDGAFAMDRENTRSPGYGLGMRLGFIDAQPYFTHSGRINGFTGQLMTLPLEQLTVATLYNCDGANDGGFFPSHAALREEALRLGRLA